MSIAIDTAFVVKLQTDPGVQATIPGGVHFDQATQGAPMPYAVVVLQGQTNEYMTSGGKIAKTLYSVDTVGKKENAVPVKNGADAIYTALQDQYITVAGYSPMLCHEEERHRHIEPYGSETYLHHVSVYAVWESKS